MNSFEVLADKINEELSSHSNRRGSNQVMAETPTLSGFAQIYQIGWKPASIHSVFDYIFGSLELLKQAGKAMSKWSMKIGEDEYILGTC